MIGQMEGSYNQGILNQIPKRQLERLAHIDFRLYFLGDLKRADLTEHFGTAPAAATRDIALYKEVAPNNIDFDGSMKVYRPSEAFQPVFDHLPQRALNALSQGFGEMISRGPRPEIRCEFPITLSLPKVDVLASITRAIHQSRPVKIRYFSNTSGETERIIAPFAIVDTGLRWHTRAYDRRSNTFRDFVLTRIADVLVLEDDEVMPIESSEHDVQWTRIIELELVPHPARERPEIVKMDYGIKDASLKVRARAATVGYMLRRWSVDCSPNHELTGPEYALWLRDTLALYGAENAILAPGYQETLPRSRKMSNE